MPAFGLRGLKLIEQLRYVRLVVEEIGQAAEFAQHVLGLEPIDRTEEIATFRSDFRDHTLVFATGDDAVQSVGLEVRYPADLDDRRSKACASLGIAAPAAGRRRNARCARSRTWCGSRTSAATASSWWCGR